MRVSESPWREMEKIQLIIAGLFSIIRPLNGCPFVRQVRLVTFYDAKDGLFSTRQNLQLFVYFLLNLCALTF